MKYNQRIFERFERLNRSEDYAGTGWFDIGEESHATYGDRVWAQSTPDEGATFYLELPLVMTKPER